jgi:hypothetical protein
MRAASSRLPDLLLEQYALGELSDAGKARVEAVLAVDDAARARLDAIARSNEEILSSSPPAEIARAVRARMLTAAGTPRRARPALALAFPAAAAALLLVGVVMFRGGLFPGAADLERPKGGAPSLFIYRASASGPIELRDGSSAAAGDVLQLKYGAGSGRFAAIASLDGRGHLTWHLPAGFDDLRGGEAPAPRIEEAGSALPSAYELDDAPFFERFFMISSRDGFDLGAVSKALRALSASGAAESGEPSLPKGLACKSLIIRKSGGGR